MKSIDKSTTKGKADRIQSIIEAFKVVIFVQLEKGRVENALTLYYYLVSVLEKLDSYVVDGENTTPDFLEKLRTGQMTLSSVEIVLVDDDVSENPINIDYLSVQDKWQLCYRLIFVYFQIWEKAFNLSFRVVCYELNLKQIELLERLTPQWKNYLLVANVLNYFLSITKRAIKSDDLEDQIILSHSFTWYYSVLLRTGFIPKYVDIFNQFFFSCAKLIVEYDRSSILLEQLAKTDKIRPRFDRDRVIFDLGEKSNNIKKNNIDVYEDAKYLFKLTDLNTICESMKNYCDQNRSSIKIDIPSLISYCETMFCYNNIKLSFARLAVFALFKKNYSQVKQMLYYSQPEDSDVVNETKTIIPTSFDDILLFITLQSEIQNEGYIEWEHNHGFLTYFYEYSAFIWLNHGRIQIKCNKDQPSEISKYLLSYLDFEYAKRRLLSLLDTLSSIIPELKKRNNYGELNDLLDRKCLEITLKNIDIAKELLQISD